MGAFMKNNEDEQNSQPIAEIEIGVRGKKPYQKPARRREKVFETSALACGKVSGTQQQCKQSKKQS
jgi:hypothetical protein